MNKNIPTPRLLISTRDAAKTLSVCEKTLWNITVPRGPIPVVRIGRRVLYHVDDLTAFVEAKKLKGGTPL